MKEELPPYRLVQSLFGVLGCIARKPSMNIEIIDKSKIIA